MSQPATTVVLRPIVRARAREPVAGGAYRTARNAEFVAGPLYAERFGMSTINASTQTAKKNAMNADAEPKKEESLLDWKKGLETLEQARDEIALKLHLATMEAKTEWDKLDTSIRETNHFHSTAERSDEEKHSIVSDLVDKVRAFGERLTAKS